MKRSVLSPGFPSRSYPTPSSLPVIMIASARTVFLGSAEFFSQSILLIDLHIFFSIPGCISHVYSSRIVYACIGKNVTLTCDVQGLSLVKLEWIYNGKIAKTKDYAISQTNVSSTLLIHEYKSQNAGLYECRVLSSSGKGISRQRFTVSTGMCFSNAWPNLCFRCCLHVEGQPY